MQGSTEIGARGVADNLVLFSTNHFCSPQDLSNKYLVSHLITYLGNKRRLLAFISSGIDEVKQELNKDKLSCFDGFAGSGVVSRLMKHHATHLVSNDFEDYAYTINRAYLTNASTVDIKRLGAAIEFLNDNKFRQTSSDYFITENYAPKNDNNIELGERAFYTSYNARIIDNIRYLIDTEVDEDLKEFCLANLLVKASVHNNTSGVFKGFHKKDGVGHFGGKGENALVRIKGEIHLEVPIFSERECDVDVYKRDTNELIKELPEVDLAYFDPPYNQHPYGSNYFMLNIINGGKPARIQNGVSGIAEDWQRSDYNKRVPAEKAMSDLIGSTKAKYILISYNDEGIIPYDTFKEIVEKFGKWKLLEQEYNTYRGSRNLSGRTALVKEYLWLIKVN